MYPRKDYLHRTCKSTFYEVAIAITSESQMAKVWSCAVHCLTFVLPPHRHGPLKLHIRHATPFATTLRANQPRRQAQTSCFVRHSNNSSSAPSGSSKSQKVEAQRLSKVSNGVCCDVQAGLAAIHYIACLSQCCGCFTDLSSSWCRFTKSCRRNYNCRSSLSKRQD